MILDQGVGKLCHFLQTEPVPIIRIGKVLSHMICSIMLIQYVGQSFISFL